MEPGLVVRAVLEPIAAQVVAVKVATKQVMLVERVELEPQTKVLTEAQEGQAQEAA